MICKMVLHLHSPTGPKMYTGAQGAASIMLIGRVSARLMNYPSQIALCVSKEKTVAIL